jgi:hypothetical protein
LKRKTENLNTKRFFMKTDLMNEKGKTTDEPIVIPDECGDSLWDAVLNPPSPFEREAAGSGLARF